MRDAIVGVMRPRVITCVVCVLIGCFADAMPSLRTGGPELSLTETGAVLQRMLEDNVAGRVPLVTDLDTSSVNAMVSVSIMGLFLCFLALGFIAQNWRSPAITLIRPYQCLLVPVCTLVLVNISNLVAAIAGRIGNNINSSVVSCLCESNVWLFYLAMPVLSMSLGSIALLYGGSLFENKMKHVVPWATATVGLVSVALLAARQGSLNAAAATSGTATNQFMVTCLNGRSPTNDPWLIALGALSVCGALLDFFAAFHLSYCSLENASLFMGSVLVVAVTGMRLGGPLVGEKDTERSKYFILSYYVLAMVLTLLIVIVLVFSRMTWLHLSEREVFELMALKTELRRSTSLVDTKNSRNRKGWVPQDGGKDFISKVDQKYKWMSARSLRGLSPREDSSKRQLSFDLDSLEEVQNFSGVKKNIEVVSSQEETPSQEETSSQSSLAAPSETHQTRKKLGHSIRTGAVAAIHTPEAIVHKITKWGTAKHHDTIHEHEEDGTEAYSQKHVFATIKLQATQRGARVRRILTTIKTNAAVTIQASYRGKRARNKVQKQKQAKLWAPYRYFGSCSSGGADKEESIARPRPAPINTFDSPTIATTTEPSLSPVSTRRFKLPNVSRVVYSLPSPRNMLSSPRRDPSYPNSMSNLGAENRITEV